MKESRPFERMSVRNSPFARVFLVTIHQTIKSANTVNTVTHSKDTQRFRLKLDDFRRY